MKAKFIANGILYFLALVYLVILFVVGAILFIVLSPIALLFHKQVKEHIKKQTNLLFNL